MNVSQVQFLHWLEFYQSIYDLDKKEKPHESVIEEDALIDEWLKNYIWKRDHESKIPAKHRRRKKEHENKITFGD